MIVTENFEMYLNFKQQCNNAIIITLIVMITIMIMIIIMGTTITIAVVTILTKTIMIIIIIIRRITIIDKQIDKLIN